MPRHYDEAWMARSVAAPRRGVGSCRECGPVADQVVPSAPEAVPVRSRMLITEELEQAPRLAIPAAFEKVPGARTDTRRPMMAPRGPTGGLPCC